MNRLLARTIGLCLFALVWILGPTAVTANADALAPPSSPETFNDAEKLGQEIAAFLKKYPQMESAFGRTFVAVHWQDLVELGKAAGEYARGLYEYGLPALKEAQRRYAGRVVTLDPEIAWNHLPKPYPFKEVYEIWKRPIPVAKPVEMDSGIGTEREMQLHL